MSYKSSLSFAFYKTEIGWSVKIKEKTNKKNLNVNTSRGQQNCLHVCPHAWGGLCLALELDPSLSCPDPGDSGVGVEVRGGGEEGSSATGNERPRRRGTGTSCTFPRLGSTALLLSHGPQVGSPYVPPGALCTTCWCVRECGK